MDYQIGSLSNLISSNSSTEDSTFKSSKISFKARTIHFKAVEEGNRKKKSNNESYNEFKAKKAKFDSTFVKPYFMTGCKKKFQFEDKKVKFDSESVKPSKKTLEPKILKPILKANEINALRRVKRKQSPKEESPRSQNEIFVGNLPSTIKKKKLKAIFNQFGNIKNVRLRNAVPINPKVPKKVAVIKGEFHPGVDSLNGYVVFEDHESAEKALIANGTFIGDHHIRVKFSNDKEHDTKKAVYVGNIPFGAKEDEIWKIFQSCGEISDVRLIRDEQTGMGKGFGYINFKDVSSVELALKLNSSKLNNRDIRVSRCKDSKTLKKEKNKLNKKSKLKFFQKNVASSKQENTNVNFQGNQFKKDKKKKKTKLGKDQRRRKMISKILYPSDSKLTPKQNKKKKKL